MFTSDNLLSGKLPDVRVGIGRGTTLGHVEESVAAFPNNDIVIYDDPELLASDLMNGKIDAAIRGDMSSSKLLPILKRETGLKALERVVLLEPLCGKLFFLAPVGIDEGWTPEQKHDLVVKSVDLMGRIGMRKRIAIMSGGRCEDFGRCPGVDRSINEARELTDRLNSEGYEAYHSQILIEDAVREADLIIATDGITGNLIFRTLHFIGGAKALGAPILNMDKVFIDTSRVKKDYRDSIVLAMKMTEELK